MAPLHMNLAVGGTLDTINENNNVTIRGNEKNEQNLKLSKIAQISSFVFTTCCYINPMYTGNPLLVLWQTVKIQMKCSIMLHFIRIGTVC